MVSITPYGEGNGNPPQYSCLENPMDQGAWWATVHGVAKSQTWLSDWQLSFLSSFFGGWTGVVHLGCFSLKFSRRRRAFSMKPSAELAAGGHACSWLDAGWEGTVLAGLQAQGRLSQRQRPARKNQPDREAGREGVFSGGRHGRLVNDDAWIRFPRSNKALQTQRLNGAQSRPLAVRMPRVQNGSRWPETRASAGPRALEDPGEARFPDLSQVSEVPMIPGWWPLPVSSKPAAQSSVSLWLFASSLGPCDSWAHLDTPGWSDVTIRWSAAPVLPQSNNAPGHTESDPHRFQELEHGHLWGTVILPNTPCISLSK